MMGDNNRNDFPQDENNNGRRYKETDFEDVNSGEEFAGGEGSAEEMTDVNTYATGGFDFPVEEPAPKPKKKKKGGLFGRNRKKRQPDFDENDESVYGVQIKPLSEFRKGFNPVTGEFDLADQGYADLFDDSKKAIDDEVAENFKRLQKERRSRVAEAVQSAGMEESEIADELGIVAPMPVSSFAGDPYTKQHGIDPKGVQSDEEMPEFQKAMLENVSNDTMEVKLNVANDTMELQRVSAEAETPASAPTSAPERARKRRRPPQNAQQRAEGAGRDEAISENTSEATNEAISENTDKNTNQTTNEIINEDDKSRNINESQSNDAGEDIDRTIPMPDELPDGKSPREEIIEGRPQKEIPRVESEYEYRSRGIPTHVINADLLQKAILTEAGEITSPDAVQTRGDIDTIPIRRQARQPRMDTSEFENLETRSEEMIDDYTGEEDARAISNELRGDMRDLTLRMLISAGCTIALIIVNLIFNGTFKSTEDLGSAPLVYIILTLLFLGVTIGVCHRTVINGLRALFSFSANSDSAAAVASVGVLLQACTAVFFPMDVVNGSIHLYAVVLTAILFLNTAGKLAMIRRIHSNFRFINSREQKYGVKTFDDHNTALKMVENSHVSNPVLTYQTKTGFLKRFLELSYSADPAESSSQMLAPIGMIASLVLCIICLLLTRSVPAAISALAASLCVSVAAANMVAVNFPMSRLCKRARRAGGMVVGYEGVNNVSGTNGIMLDADDLFPFGSVVLNGIKTYGDKSVAEEAVMSASALMNAAGGPLKGVFEQVISENEDSLPEVEDFEYEHEKGIVGRVNGKRIFVGNRNLLINHHLEPPARSDETPYASGNNQVIYIAVDADVSAMMVLTYSADRRRTAELQRLEDSGIGLVLRTMDPNITPDFVAKLFNLDSASVTILEPEMGEVYRKLVHRETPRSDATVATKGRVETLMNIISLCVEMKKNVNILLILQTLAIILGFILVAFLACFAAMNALSSFLLFAFMTFWALLIVILPKVKKM